MSEEHDEAVVYHRRHQEPGASDEEAGVIIRAELAASGWEVDVPQPVPEDVKETAVKHDEADDEES